MKKISLCMFALAMLAGQASAGLTDPVPGVVGNMAYIYTKNVNADELFWDISASDWTLDETKGKPVGTTETWGDGVYFSSTDLQSTGTGLIQPFLKMQAGGNADSESGYNTDAKGMLNNTDAWTYSLQLGWLADVTFDDPTDTNPPALYKQFLLDFDQTSNQPYMQMTELQIYVGPGLAGYALSDPKVWVAPTADLVYALDRTEDRTVQMDYRLDPGSGGGDIWVYIPSSLFAGYDRIDNVLLYSAFYQNNDGPDEWAVRTGEGVVIPLPGAVLLGFLGLGAAGWKLRRFA
jgi:hypothetical protein